MFCLGNCTPVYARCSVLSSKLDIVFATCSVKSSKLYICVCLVMCTDLYMVNLFELGAGYCLIDVKAVHVR